MATMGHEMGHYVMHHALTGLLFGAIVIFVVFALLRFGLEKLVARFGARWNLMSELDLAAVPVAVLILSTLGLLLTPIQNSFTRMQEYEADIFGLNASRQPDGEAEVDLLLGEYRKLDPGPLEEMIFFDHPSGRTRITAAMRWKAENLCLFSADLPCGGLKNAFSATNRVKP
jgi:STE24 endopeptidase